MYKILIEGDIYYNIYTFFLTPETRGDFSIDQMIGNEGFGKFTKLNVKTNSDYTFFGT